MKRREVAIVRSAKYGAVQAYAVMVRERGWLFWGRWRQVIDMGDRSGSAWVYEEAVRIAEQARAHGVVNCPNVDRHCYAVIELDESEGEP
jgi:hypothetical protein